MKYGSKFCAIFLFAFVASLSAAPITEIDVTQTYAPLGSAPINFSFSKLAPSWNAAGSTVSFSTPFTPSGVFIEFSSCVSGTPLSGTYTGTAETPLPCALTQQGTFTGATFIFDGCLLVPNVCFNGAQVSQGGFSIITAQYNTAGVLTSFAATFSVNAFVGNLTSATYTGDVYYNYDPSSTAAPEPSSGLLIGGCLLVGFTGSLRSRRRCGWLRHV